MLVFLKASLCILAAQAIIMTGVGVISAHVMPVTLASFYAATNAVARTVITALLVFPVANYLTAYAYSHFHAAMVAPLIFVTAVFANIVFSVFVLKAQTDWRLALATLLVMASSAWVGVLLSRAPEASAALP